MENFKTAALVFGQDQELIQVDGLYWGLSYRSMCIVLAVLPAAVGANRLKEMMVSCVLIPGQYLAPRSLLCEGQRKGLVIGHEESGYFCVF